MTSAAIKKETPVFKEPAITPALAAEHGIKPDEYQHMLKILGREPTFTELGIFSVMWSEHCSYKSSRLHLKKLPTSAPWVIQGPGENAGVIDIGDGQAAVFKMESHNHPSYIEPYQGAATGVGGIMRDVFTMGARPIANMNALRFGAPDHPKTRQLVNGVVAGIAGYGNCMGVPTVGGETNFHARYNGNILVNAMTVGVVEQDKIYYSRGAGVGQPIVYVGSKTGRDGIHGATMSSAEFDDESDSKRPTVQVGDPFVEKLLLEACLELMQSDAIICIQDMGAAGLTSSSVEIAAKGDIGVELDLDHVPQRELHMTPYEIMLSESQERMLMILQPGKEDMARAIFEKWDLDFAVIGKTTDDKHLRLHMYGKCWCDIPVPPLVDESPVYDRPQKARAAAAPLAPLTLDQDISAALVKLMQCPDLSSKRWLWEQYDSLVRGETISSPGIHNTQAHKPADAAVVRLNDKKALAMTCDVTPRYCFADPYEGGKQAVAETWRNLTATGARPLAITDNLNFGNPEKPEIMWEFVTCLQGMAEACVALSYPIISGNVSLYNETNGQGILPTPTIGGVGLIDNGNVSAGLAFTDEDQTIIVIGESKGHLGQSLYLREIIGQEDGPPPPVDLAAERRHGEFVRGLIQSQIASACHDIADGGLLVAVTEMAMASGMGAELGVTGDAAFWFGEDQARYVITTAHPDKVLYLAEKDGIPVTILGSTGGISLRIPENRDINIKEISTLNEGWLPAFMEGRS
ncbi:MAG: phosphoribosylformylglycinamidine synthase subunit PurL [Micavibrio sp.]